MSGFLTVLPLAIVMIAGPQIISAVFLATSERWRQNSAAYLAGAALSITIAFTIAYFVAEGAKDSAGGSDKGTVGDLVNVVILLLLLFAGLYTFLKRKQAEPPKWMGRLQTATPKFAFTLGILLLGIFPTDIVTSFTVGGYLSRNGEAWSDGLGFVLLTLLLLGLPVILLLLLGERARAFLPKARDWMNANSWIISEIVIAIFVVITINSLAGS